MTRERAIAMMTLDWVALCKGSEYRAGGGQRDIGGFEIMSKYLIAS